MFRRFGLLAANLTIVASACSIFNLLWHPQTTGADALYRFIRNGKAGYIAATGKVALEPFLPVQSNFDGEFHDGLLRLPDNKFIDRSGHVVINRRLRSASDFSDGFAVVTLPSGREAWMDTRGQLLAPPPGATELRSFSEGLAAVQIRGRDAFADKQGRVQIPPQFLRAFEFRDGMARVIPAERACAFWGSGPCAAMMPLNLPEWPPQLDSKKLPACKVTFIDQAGRTLPQHFDDARDFSEGLAAVRVGDSWGFIDRTGRLFIRPRFAEATPFSEGLAAVADHPDGNAGYIDRTGSWVVPPAAHLTLHPFRNGRAVARRSVRELVYIDNTGAIAIPGAFIHATDFHRGLAHVQTQATRYAWITPAGRTVFEYEAAPLR